MLYNAAEVEISLGVDFASYRIPLRLIGVSRPRRQRLKQHVARACKASISSTGGVQARPRVRVWPVCTEQETSSDPSLPSAYSVTSVTADSVR